MRNKIAVIGIGNELLQDEGAGIHAVRALQRKLAPASSGTKNNRAAAGKALKETDVQADIVEAHTGGMSLLHQFEDRKKLIFIDSGFCGARPGEYRRFTRDEVISIKKLDRFSLHEFDLLGLLEFADTLGYLEGRDVSIYCIQPLSMEMKNGLTPPVKRAVERLVCEVEDEIRGTM